MKIIKMTVFFIINIIMIGCKSHKKVSGSQANSVEYNWKLLSNEVNKNPKDTIFNCCTYSIKIMESESRIMGEASGTFLGKLYFTKKDWEKWNIWMKENKKANNKSTVRDAP